MGCSIVLERGALYEAVWREPMINLSKRYGISDVGLRKVCARMDIPVPQLGYWAKKRVGRAPDRPDLPAHRGPTNIRIHPEKYNRRARLAEDLSLACGRIEWEESEPDAQILVRSDGTLRTALVAKLANHLRRMERVSEKSEVPLVYKRVRKAAGARDVTDIVAPGPGYITIATTQAQLQRALSMADALIVGMRERGFKIEVVGQRTIFSHHGLDLSFRLTEITSRGTGAGHRRPRATGKLRLTLRSAGNQAPIGNVIAVRDQPGRPLESQLNHVATRLRQASEAFRLATHERAVQEAAEAARADRERIDGLSAEADTWHALVRRQAYIDHLEARARQSGISLEDGSAASEWFKWARKTCAAGDPTEHRLEAISAGI